MIEQLPSGRFRCRGRYCGYELAWFSCEPTAGADGVWQCLDCGDSVYAAKPEPKFKPTADEAA